jgi:glutamate-ammonia-ligase adenylyltransferase
LADSTQAEALARAASLFWSVQAAARLLTEGALDPNKAGEGGRRFLLRETGEASLPALEARLRAEADAAAAAIAISLGSAS